VLVLASATGSAGATPAFTSLEAESGTLLGGAATVSLIRSAVQRKATVRSAARRQLLTHPA
jgi:hypothetical protein